MITPPGASSCTYLQKNISPEEYKAIRRPTSQTTYDPLRTPTITHLETFKQPHPPSRVNNVIQHTLNILGLLLAFLAILYKSVVKRPE